MKSYIELDVWIESGELVNQVYDLTKKYPSTEQFGLISQMRRSVISIPSNIAEGCGRQTNKDSIHFFYIARGSLFGLETQLYLSFDQEYIKQRELGGILKQIISCKKLLNGFINYYKKVNIKPTTNNQ